MNKFFTLFIFLILVSGISGMYERAHAESKESLVKKGNAQFMSGNYDEAISAYDAAAVTDPESPFIYFNKGTALYKKQDYAAARDAFVQAAIKSKDIFLEAKSKYNSGLCFFKEGERQKDSDLKKALELYGSSVASFQEALTLNSDFSEAAENIEMVRLVMKSVLDEIKKQEEAAKQQQEQCQAAAERIRELIEKQEALLNDSQSLMDPAKKGSSDDPVNKQTDEMASAQDQLRQETRNLSEQLEQQQASSPASSTASAQPDPSLQHLNTSADEQEAAVERFRQNDTPTAANHQQKSLDALNKSLESLSGSQDQKGGEQPQENQPQSQEAQQANQQQQQQQNGNDQDSGSPSQNDQGSMPEEKKDQDQNQGVLFSDDADSILDEEKDNKKHRMPYSAGGFREVDKDW